MATECHVVTEFLRVHKCKLLYSQVKGCNKCSRALSEMSSPFLNFKFFTFTVTLPNIDIFLSIHINIFTKCINTDTSIIGFYIYKNFLEGMEGWGDLRSYYNKKQLQIQTFRIISHLVVTCRQELRRRIRSQFF